MLGLRASEAPSRSSGLRLSLHCVATIATIGTASSCNARNASDRTTSPVGPKESHHPAQLSRRSAHVTFESLAADVAQLSFNGNVLLAGDLKARVGWQLIPVMMPLRNCRTVTAPLSAMAASSCTCMRRLPWSSALAELLGTTQLSPVSRHAATLHLPA